MKNKYFRMGIIISVVMLISSFLLVLPISKNLNFGLDLKGGFEVLYLVENLDGDKVTSKEVESTYKAISNRIDTLGVSEPEIIVEGDKIRVKLPGVTNENEARERLSTPAVLSFRNSSNELLMTSSVLDTPGASLDYDKNTNRPVVALSIKDNDTFYRMTKKISETSDKLIVIWLDFEDGDLFNRETCGTDSKKCISAATVNEGFSNNVIIQGNFTEKEASELVDLINSGSLPTKLTEISTKTVDASYGIDTLKNVEIAGIITLVVIILIMIYFYKVSGLISGICLVLYTALVFLIFNLIDGVLTLTGIAALILGIGMAIDGSIITLEKIKEELANGKSLESAYKDGNKRSLVSLIDANITTFIAALVLFIFGESNVKGFATMLMITIFVSSLVMIYLNRLILNNFIKSKKFKDKINLLVGKVKKVKIRETKKVSLANIIVVSLIIIVGGVFVITKSLNFGIDFKGGSSLTIKGDNIEEKEISNILSNYNISDKETINDNEIYYKIEETLNDTEVKELKGKLEDLNYKSDISVISNVVKRDLTKNAIKSLIIASVAILIYITIRFTSRFAISSIIAILTDIIVTVFAFAILRIEVNFIFIAAILTIIGYSINDTIVVFDMIRDKYISVKNVNDEKIKEVVNTSISLSLKRNILTSLTTLTAVFVLLIMNTTGVKEFNIAILIGLLSGTFSSLFIAPYIWMKLEIQRLKKPKKDKEEDEEIKERLIKGINS